MSATALTITAATAAARWAGPWGFGFPWFVILIPLFWILVAALLFAIFGRRWRRAAAVESAPYGSRGPHSAEASLAERFAQGDVDEVEYRARLEVLRANGPTP